VASDAQYEIAIGDYRFDPREPPAEFAHELREEGAGARRAKQPRRAVIVQFIRPLTAEDRRRLQEEFRLQLSQYVPNLAYLERLAPDTIAALAEEELVRAYVPYDPAFKLAPTIGKVPFRTSERRALKEILLEILLFDDTDPAEVVDKLAESGASDIVTFDDRSDRGPLRMRFRLEDPARINDISRIEEVQWIEEVPEVIEDDVGAAGAIQSGSATVQSIWDRGLHGEGQIIGIIDTSPVDINHCYLRDSPNNNPGPTHRKVQELRNSSDTDPTFHATFVAGCAAGDDIDDPGASAGRGSAWAARIVSGNQNDFGLVGVWSELSAASAAGARIHTNSWHDKTDDAGDPAKYNITAFLVDLFTWRNEENLVLGSAGNTNEEQGPPGTAKNAICVAAAQSDPNEMNLGDGNPGPTADGRRKPDLVAVGCNIRSARQGTRCSTSVRGCATSWATPHAAGAATLVRQYFTEGWYPNGRPLAAFRMRPSGALLKGMLINSTIDMTGVSGYPSDVEGWGLIRLENVLRFQSTGPILALWDRWHSEGLSTGDTAVHGVDVISGRTPLKITLVWTDPQSLIHPDPSLVNDLDLRVTSPDGQTFLGNNFVDGESVSGGTRDDLNTVEVVLIATPDIGRWTITIDAHRVNVGEPGQGYALVASTARPEWLIPALHLTMS
jgi:hypothetical protein